MGESWQLATSEVALVATLCLKKPHALLASFTQANVHSLNKHLFLTGHASVLVLAVRDAGVKAIALPQNSQSVGHHKMNTK